MRTFDLRIVGRALRRQMEASIEIFDAIDRLKALKASLPAERQQEIDEIATGLARANTRIIDSAGDVNQDLQEFIRQ